MGSSAGRTFNEAGLSATNALAVESNEDFMALTLEESQRETPSPGYLDPELLQNSFNPTTDMAPIYEGLSDQRVWPDAAEHQLNMPAAPDNPFFDLGSIISTAQSARPVSNSPTSTRLGEVGCHVSPGVVSSPPENQTNESNSIDQRPGFQGTYFGLSGESDPYLLRHYLYNEADEFPFLRVIYRRTQRGICEPYQPPQNAQNAEAPDIPVQFLLTANELGEEHTRIGPHGQLYDHDSVRKELNGLVSDEHGRRLILLFVQYVYPGLPVISRSQLALEITGNNVPSAVGPVPAHALAAIYASALPFSSYDDVLCVSSVYKKPSSERLWQIVYDGVQADLHTPRLATISSALLFLNRPRVGVQHVSADTSFTWSFTTSIVGLVTSLGLHLDCKSWSIPNWEKRLRRRLWWMAYSEATWRSLLLGRPSVISPDQWSVSGLARSDFDLDDMSLRDDMPPGIGGFMKRLRALGTGSEDGLISQHLATLACIADHIHRGLYTVRATAQLADNLDESVKAIKPLREELALWYAGLPMALKSPKADPERTTPIEPSSAACLRFAYLTLEVLLYRALLRPLGAVDLEDANVHGEANTDLYGELWPESQDFCIDTEQRANGQEQHDGFRDQAELIISAAEKCATIVTNFTVELMSWDFAGFWHSWSRIGWATTSSFLAILLVQSPSVKHAKTSKALIDRWRQILRHQSQSFQDMSLGILRLDAMYWSDMNKIFKVNSHLAQVIQESK